MSHQTAQLLKELGKEFKGLVASLRTNISRCHHVAGMLMELQGELHMQADSAVTPAGLKEGTDPDGHGG